MTLSITLHIKEDEGEEDPIEFMIFLYYMRNIPDYKESPLYLINHINYLREYYY